MKKKPFSYYLDLVKSAQDKKDWNKAKLYGEIVLKKLPILSYSSIEEYFLYTRIGRVYFNLAEYSRSLDFSCRADLIASKKQLAPVYNAYALYMKGLNFRFMKNYRQALFQFKKIELYYQKYGDATDPMDKNIYVSVLIALGHCYLYTNKFELVQEIIDKKIPAYLPFISEKIMLREYYQLKGKYLFEQKKYSQSRQAFQECLKISKELCFIKGELQAKFQLISISLLEGQLESAMQSLEFILSDARKFKINDFICESGLLLSKCYFIRNMAGKSASIERQIKPFLNKLDIIWLYEMTRQIERFSRRLSRIYNYSNVPLKEESENESITKTLTHAIKRYHGALSYKDVVIGESIPMQEIYQIIEKIAPTDLPVLIQGETGTGKELIAEIIYQNSLRKGKPWFAVNCGAIPETLLELSLFGHTKGAFTDAHQDKQGYIKLASEGTLFLDEISEMSPQMQQKFLRALEEKQVWPLGAEKPVPVDTRFIFAGNRNIEELVRTKKFREDLYYRINTIVISIPPLKEHKDDIPLLVKHFLAKYSVSPKSKIRNQKSEIEIAPNALALLQDYPWPGNVRELENEIKRICVLYSKTNLIAESMLSESIRNNKHPFAVTSDRAFLKEAKKLAEKDVIMEMLKKCNGNIAETARQFGYNRTGFYRKIKKLRIISKGISGSGNK